MADGVRSLHTARCETFPPHCLHGFRSQSPYSLLSLCVDTSLVAQTRHIADFLGELVGRGYLSMAEKNRFIKAVSSLPVMTEPYDALRSLKDQIIAFPEQEISLADMANYVHLDKFYFIRAFKKRYGITPYVFLRQNRIRKARHRLVSDDTITRTALQAGFYDQSHFIRHFKRLHGLTPRQYLTSRERVRATVRQHNGGINFAKRSKPSRPASTEC